jgi:hypothetical protein
MNNIQSIQCLTAFLVAGSHVMFVLYGFSKQNGLYSCHHRSAPRRPPCTKELEKWPVTQVASSFLASFTRLRRCRKRLPDPDEGRPPAVSLAENPRPSPPLCAFGSHSELILSSALVPAQAAPPVPTLISIVVRLQHVFPFKTECTSCITPELKSR